MKRLLIDVSSLLWQSLLTSTDKEFSKEVEHEGKMVRVNGWQHGYECAINHLLPVFRELELTPVDAIFVVEGEYSKARRKAIYSGYKESRDSRPPEAYVQFNLCKEKLMETFLALGSQVVQQDGAEGDDCLAYLCKHLEGDKVILTTDGDMTTLVGEHVALWQRGMLTSENKYGPFPHRFVPFYKALCGDGSEYKGAAGFGPKAFLDMLVAFGNGGLAGLEGMMKRGVVAGNMAPETAGTLIDLEDDVASFKPFRKVIDSAKHVYESYQCAVLHDEWCNTPRQPLRVEFGKPTGKVTDQRLQKWANFIPVASWFQPTKNANPVFVNQKHHVVFDTELIGNLTPVYLVCTEIVETGEKASFWWHREGQMAQLHEMLKREDLTWISFNGIHFDAPIMSAAIEGINPLTLKEMAQALIVDGAKSWDMSELYDYKPLEFDHIDLFEVAPGVKISLKAFAGRMGYKTMVDLPFEHDKDLTDDETYVLESYCYNDVGVTKALFNLLRSEVELRKEMSDEHGIDLRSKSDAQVAEAVLKKAASIKGKAGDIPSFVTYKAPGFISTESSEINELIERIERTKFKINKANGQVEAPEFLKEPIRLCSGTYQCGVGGLHSTHDHNLYAEATDDVLISDWDVASYYPNIMLKAGLTPRLDGGAGSRFIKAYEDIYVQRMEAKHSGNTKVANALKISLNGTFGKLGSQYSAFYSPDLLLGVTLTGQLNLMCLIYDLEFNQNIKVLSANTDGITVQYPVKHRERILSLIADNAARTGFEYEETRYSKIAMKDVNNYLALTTNGKVKRKGLYAAKGLMKNPTMAVCSNLAVEYLKSGIHPAEAIKNHTDMSDFVAVRAVKGGGIQYDEVIEVDDWVLVKDLGTKDNEWSRQAWLDAGLTRVVKRKSNPRPVEVGVGGERFGRMARWHMSTEPAKPINYVGSGNKVPKTDGAKLCMTLPDELPPDLNVDWYVAETISMLKDMGVDVAKQVETV